MAVTLAVTVAAAMLCPVTLVTLTHVNDNCRQCRVTASATSTPRRRHHKQARGGHSKVCVRVEEPVGVQTERSHARARDHTPRNGLRSQTQAAMPPSGRRVWCQMCTVVRLDEPTPNAGQRHPYDTGEGLCWLLAQGVRHVHDVRAAQHLVWASDGAHGDPVGWNGV